MNKIEQKFLTLIRSNRMRSFYTAHRILEVVSTPVLFAAANELVNRARYLYNADDAEKADYANQFASQISGVLNSRNQDVTELDAKIEENSQVF
jgi:hypothetical protein